MHMSKIEIKRAIAWAGSQDKLGRAIDFSQNAIRNALATGHVSPLMAFRIDAATRGRIGYADLLDAKRELRRARKHVNGAR